MTDKKEKSGIWGLIKESLTQTGCGCGPGGCGPSCEPSKDKGKKEGQKDNPKDNSKK
ncbi:hypothetical protein [Pectinatus frisingensis]|uniref:hypothetical protein n=1 Tax=Pectinatus frisingensis TaxID=865 RepID=UPI0018C5473A|nr:hypothetical protein [Pectinatus frisingensis]